MRRAVVAPGRGFRSWSALLGTIAVGLAILASAVFVGSAIPLASRSSSGPPTECPRLSAGRLGAVGYVRGGALHVVDVATCADRVLLRRGVHAPVRWSPDGRWIAFGSAAVVADVGGDVLHPLEKPVSQWEWSPGSDVIGAVTERGGVVIGGPGVQSRQLLPDGWGATSLAFDPPGERIAISRLLTAGRGRSYRIVDQGVWIASVAGGAPEEVYRVTPGTIAPPIVAGWSPDGRWALFWSDLEGSSSIAADGLPLDAVSADGDGTVTISESVLVFRDFLSSCGSRLVVTSGSDRYVNIGKRLLSVEPHSWGFLELAGDPARSWFWPACSPDARWVAATVAPSRYPKRIGQDPRSIWLLAADGSARERITKTPNVADEFPRWSADGRFVLFVRRGLSWHAPGALYLAELDPSTEQEISVFGPIATLGPGGGYYGHSIWSEESDWYHPTA